MESEAAGWPMYPCTLLLIRGTNEGLDCFAIIFECTKIVSFLVFNFKKWRWNIFYHI